MNQAAKFVVLTTSRSGSTMFMDSLNRISGVEGHMELFLDQFRRKPAIAGRNDYPRFVEKRAEIRSFRPKATWRYLSELYRRNRSVGFKLMYTHLKNYPEIVPYAIARRIKVVHLVRYNYLDSVISEELARLTGDSHSTNSNCSLNQPIYLDPEDTLKAIRTRSRQVDIMSWTCKLIGSGSMTVYYEELLQEYAGSMKRVCDFLGIRNTGRFERSRLKKRQTRRKGDVIGNYDDIKSTLSRHGYGHFIDS